MRIHRSNSDSNLYCKKMVSESSRQTPVITERHSVSVRPDTWIKKDLLSSRVTWKTPKMRGV